VPVGRRHGGYALLMTIGTGEKAERFGYFVHPIPADFGLGFHFEKFSTDQEEGEPPEYDVNIDLQHGRHTCECKGFQRWNHCKHISSLLSLIQRGKIAVPAAKPQPAPKPEAKRPFCEMCNDIGLFCTYCCP
jgi:hypothetical protein